MPNEPASRPGSPLPPLRSEFDGDAEMSELIEFFIGELNGRIAAMHAALSNGDTAAMRLLAHQLKGAASGYGYPAITEAAARVEYGLLPEEAAISSVAEKVEELITLCRRAARS
jgi:HPt (histidine-containing phosphotransfer) domain-containing protein